MRPVGDKGNCEVMSEDATWKDLPLLLHDIKTPVISIGDKVMGPASTVIVCTVTRGNAAF